jgi:hypothetical protein
MMSQTTSGRGQTNGGNDLPKLDILPLEEAQLDSATGKRAQILREYVGYIEQVPAGQAGKLSPANGETLSAIRRRLGAASKQLGKSLIIKRTDDNVYFWVSNAEAPRRRGRPPKNPR